MDAAEAYIDMYEDAKQPESPPNKNLERLQHMGLYEIAESISNFKISEILKFDYDD